MNKKEENEKIQNRVTFRLNNPDFARLEKLAGKQPVNKFARKIISAFLRRQKGGGK